MKTVQAVFTSMIALTIVACSQKEEPKPMPEEMPANQQQMAPKQDTMKHDSTMDTSKKTTSTSKMTKEKEEIQRTGTKEGNGSVMTSTSKKTKTSTTIQEEKPPVTSPDGGITTTTTKKKK